MDQLPFAPTPGTTSRPNTPEVPKSQANTGRMSKDPGMILIPPSPPTSNSSTPTSTTDSSRNKLWKRVVEAMVARDVRQKEQSGEEPPSKESLPLSSLPGERNEEVDKPQSGKPTQEDIEEMNLQSHLEMLDQCSTPQSSTGESTPPPVLQERHGESTLGRTFPPKTHVSRKKSPVGAQTPVPPMRQKSSGSNPKSPQRDPLASVARYINGITKSLYNSHEESINWPGKKEEWPRKKGYWIGDRLFQWIPGSPLKRDPGTYPPCTPTQPPMTPGTQLPGMAGNSPGQTPCTRPYGPIPWLERPSTKTYGTHFPPPYSWEGNTEQSQKKKKKVKIVVPPPTPPLTRTKPSMSLVLNFSTEDIFNTKKPGGDWTKPHLPSEEGESPPLPNTEARCALKQQMKKWRGIVSNEKDDVSGVDTLDMYGGTANVTHKRSGSSKTGKGGRAASHDNKWNPWRNNVFAADSLDILDGITNAPLTGPNGALLEKAEPKPLDNKC
ncbi:uncharacterized protein EV420DRAFT_1473528 [Desarmillaria tabescens]|uniref:Uncharacterized protein n=1 Tax=Armillaria tabescens TaxID=1929756 RepID=A0AA39TUF4_ARMTA|nr:uncharacterized protein EV420DRAFT_1473528 [Desarmillaria tabescens]KAK0470472.1 hypothetical protein EV420DRAFT_1473528 [Desarmillaria tabescens]